MHFNQKGQVIFLYALTVAFMMVMMSFVLNTSRLVDHKMRMQTAVDIAAYNAASILGYYMSNNEGTCSLGLNISGNEIEAEDTSGCDSVAEINRWIMERYVKFVGEVTLVNCADPAYTKFNTNGLLANCPAEFQAIIPTDPCDSDPTPSPWSAAEGGAKAKLAIVDLFLKYEADITAKTNTIQYITQAAREIALSSVQETMTKNLADLRPEKELMAFITPIDFDVETDAQGVQASFYSMEEGSTTVAGSTLSIVSCIAWFTSLAQLNTATAYYPDETPQQVYRRLLFDRDRTSNYVVVGAVQSAHDPATDVGDEGNPAFDYVNFSATFGRVDAPMMQAWSAAAPFRKVPADEGGLPHRDDIVNWQIKNQESYKRDCSGDGTSGCKATAQFHRDFYTARFAGNAATLIEDYGDSENPDPLYYPMTANYSAYNPPPTALGSEYPDFRARFIPLAGGWDHQEIDYFGASDGSRNPFAAYGFSEVLFGGLNLSGIEGMSGKSAADAFRYLFRH